MGQDPSQIRQDIEDTREQMGTTVEALGHKTDVSGRAKEAVSDKVDTVRSKAGLAQENPLGLGVAAVAAGFLAGLLVPGTKVEDEKLGPIADDVKQMVQETGREHAEQLKDRTQHEGVKSHGNA